MSFYTTYIKKSIQTIRFLISIRKPKELLFRLLELIVGYPLYVLSYCVIRNPKKWVFGTNVGFVDNAKYLFIDVCERNEIKAYWIAPDRKTVKFIKQKGLSACYKYSVCGLYHCLTAYVYVFTYHSKDINFWTSARAKKVNLWHGVGIKSGDGGKNNKGIKANANFVTCFLMPHLFEKNDIFLSTSPLMNAHFQHMFSLNTDAIFETMYPRCVFLQKEEHKIDAFIQKYESNDINAVVQKMKQFSRVFLYMPTWRGNFNDDFIAEADFDFKRLNQILKEKNQLFILKLHPAVKYCKEAYQNLDAVMFLDKHIDIYPLLPFTHVLITDYSSIYYDFLLLKNKEFILYPFDYETYIVNSNRLAFDYNTYTPGVKVYNFDELIQCIQNESIDLNIENKPWIRNQFWGHHAATTNDALYQKIKTL